MPFGLTGDIPVSACANCRDMTDLALIPYRENTESPMLAVLILCGLCRHALNNNELGCHLDLRVAGQEGWVK